MKPTNMAEALKYSKEDSDIKGFIKKFARLKEKEALEIKERIEKLENVKIKPEHITKIIDMLPEDSADVSKIFDDVSLDQDETNKILEAIKEFK